MGDGGWEFASREHQEGRGFLQKVFWGWGGWCGAWPTSSRGCLECLLPRDAAWSGVGEWGSALYLPGCEPGGMASLKGAIHPEGFRSTTLEVVTSRQTGGQGPSVFPDLGPDEVCPSTTGSA